MSEESSAKSGRALAVSVTVIVLSGALGLGLSAYSLFAKAQRALPGAGLSESISWLLYGDGQQEFYGVIGDLGTGVFSAAVFLVLVQLTLDRSRSVREESRRTRSEVASLLERFRLGGQATAVALADMRSSGVLQSGGLRGAFLSNLRLRDLDLGGAQLPGADLRGSDLSGCSLIGANLKGSKLDGAELRGADLSFADLQGSGATDAALREAKSLWRCTLPGGQIYSGEWRLTGDLQTAGKLGIDLTDPVQYRTFYLGEGNA